MIVTSKTTLVTKGGEIAPDTEVDVKDLGMSADEANGLISRGILLQAEVAEVTINKEPIDAEKPRKKLSLKNKNVSN